MTAEQRLQTEEVSLHEQINTHFKQRPTDTDTKCGNKSVSTDEQLPE